MKALLIAAAFSLLTATQAFAATGFCAKYEKNAKYLDAIKVLAKNMQYGFEELCNLPRLADIYVTKRSFYNEQNELIPHVWVTLHYMEYSCQYFLRESDLVTTRKNCYNTI